MQEWDLRRDPISSDGCQAQTSHSCNAVFAYIMQPTPWHEFQEKVFLPKSKLALFLQVLLADDSCVARLTHKFLLSCISYH